jgi:hypothetical protein
MIMLQDSNPRDKAHTSARRRCIVVPETILASLSVILEPGQVTELRALDAATATERRPHVEAGYFNDPEKLTRAAANISHAKGVYFVLNPVNPALLARAVNKIRPAPRGESTGDGDILCRRWLPIDADPVRPAGIASTDAEHQAALDRVGTIAATLAAEGWPEPIVADSGNGGHLLYRIDLPANDGGLVQRCLKAMTSRFDNDVVKIDTSVFNPARIWKLYGTMAGKGDAEAAALGRPHRMARVLKVPNKLEVVPRELLESLAANAPAPATRRTPRTATHRPVSAPAAAVGSTFNLEDWIQEHALDVTGPEDWRDQTGQSGRRWVFRVCPWNSDHTDGSAFIVQFAGGAIAAGCHHNGCSGQDWHALRDAVEPGWRENGRGTPGESAEPKMGPAETNALFDRISAAGGGSKLLDDGDLMRDLARMSICDSWAYARARGRCADQKVRLRDFDAAIKHLRKQIIQEMPPPPGTAGPYQQEDGRIVYLKPTPAGAVPVPLSDFAACIVEQTIIDDGSPERRTVLSIQGQLADGPALPRVEVSATEFSGMRWPVERWGTRAVVNAGAGTADHLRCAIQKLSGNPPTRTVFAHLGWREVGGRVVYLHARGAIDANGPTSGVEVSLPDPLAGYTLPDPPTGADLVAAVRASLAVLDLAPDRITAPLLGAVYRAVLGPADYALHLVGPTGAGKTEVATLAQQHHGAALDARRLPGSWASTGNSLEALAFAAKDALLVVDDFAPGGSTHDVQRYHREADRLLRAQGNRSGRARCRTDGTIRPARPPRGTILATGEDVPRGQSLRARLLVLEMPPPASGGLDWPYLSVCQRDAAAGLYAAALAGYCRWLALRYHAVRDGLRAETVALREQVQAEGLHPRTPGIVADLAAGWRWWLDYAQAVSAIDQAERNALTRRVWAALLEAAWSQADHVAAADPAGQFLRLLAGALASGRAYVAGPDDEAPTDAAAWGWRKFEFQTRDGPDTRWEPQGRRIGWLDGPDLLLEPEASYAEAQELARHQGEALPVGTRTLWRRLRERRLLVSTEPGKLLTRRTLEGQRRFVIHLTAASLYAEKLGEQGEQRDNPGKHSDLYPCSSPDSEPCPLEQGEQKGQKLQEKAGFAPVPPNPPVSGGRDTPEEGNYSLGPYRDGY